MKSFLGQVTAGDLEPTEISVLIFDKEIHLGYRVNEKPVTLAWPLNNVDTIFNLPLQATILKYNNKVVTIEGKEAHDYIISKKQEIVKPWFKKSSTRNRFRLGSFVIGIIVLLIAAWLLLVPWMAERLASRVSVETEESFGNTAYDAMGMLALEDSNSGLLANHFFEALQIPSNYSIHISVVKSPELNAFALPGGRIVIFDGLLKKMNSYPELVALLSHEFTHVNNRHSTKSIFRQLGSRLFINLLFGGNVGGLVADNAERLKSLKYSRSLEKEADLNGLKIMLERNIDPEGFSHLFSHLKEGMTGSDVPELLESHPDIEKRIAYINDASKNYEGSQHPELKAIFDKLKQTLK